MRVAEPVEHADHLAASVVLDRIDAVLPLRSPCCVSCSTIAWTASMDLSSVDLHRQADKNDGTCPP